MKGTAKQDRLFKANPSKPEAKADITSHAARAIIDAEAQSRDAKTARLRQARLAVEAAAPPQPAPADGKRKTAAKRTVGLR